MRPGTEVTLSWEGTRYAGRVIRSANDRAQVELQHDLDGDAPLRRAFVVTVDVAELAPLVGLGASGGR